MNAQGSSPQASAGRAPCSWTSGSSVQGATARRVALQQLNSALCLADQPRRRARCPRQCSAQHHRAGQHNAVAGWRHGAIGGKPCCQAQSWRSHSCGVCRRRRTRAHSSRLLPLTSSVIVSEVSSNTIFMAGMCGWGIAQVAKVFTHRFKKGKWDVLQLIASGGMPSSHSSLCMSVTSAIGVVHGFGSTLFAMALTFSLIVMYDAAGVRRHAGTQAEVLNMVVKELLTKHEVSQRKLKEVLGHTPLQVCMGALVGVFSGFLYATQFQPAFVVA